MVLLNANINQLNKNKMNAKEKANEIANKMYRGNVFEKTKDEHLIEL